MSVVASLEKWSFRSTTLVPGGRLPTQSACPDCLGFLGGPRNHGEWRGPGDAIVKLLLLLLLLIKLPQSATKLSLHDNQNLVLTGETDDSLGALIERISGSLVRYPELKGIPL